MLEEKNSLKLPVFSYFSNINYSWALLNSLYSYHWKGGSLLEALTSKCQVIDHLFLGPRVDGSDLRTPANRLHPVSHILYVCAILFIFLLSSMTLVTCLNIPAVSQQCHRVIKERLRVRGTLISEDARAPVTLANESESWWRWPVHSESICELPRSLFEEGSNFLNVSLQVWGLSHIMYI